MAASRTTLFLLALVALATLCASAKACSTCSSLGKRPVDVQVAILLNVQSCKLSLQVNVGAVVAADRAKSLKVCPGGKATPLDLLKVHVGMDAVVQLKVDLLGKRGTVAAVANVKVNLRKVAKVVGDVLNLELTVVGDAQHKWLRFLCRGLRFMSSRSLAWT